MPQNSQTGFTTGVSSQPPDYDALARQAGATSSRPAEIDYDALAKQAGATSSVKQSDNDQSSASEDFGTELWKQISPVAQVKGAAQVTAHPIETIKNDAEARQKVYSDAEGAFQRGDYVEGAAHLLYSAIPFLGPQLNEAANNFVKGKIAKGAGESVGMGLAMVEPTYAAKGLGAAKTALKAASPVASVEEALARKIAPAEADAPRPGGVNLPALNNTPREVLNYSKKIGVDLTPGQATEDAMAQNLQKAGTTAAVGGSDLKAALLENQSNFAKAANDFRTKVDPKGQGISAEQAGQSLQQTAKVARDISHENASQGYAQINDLMDKPVDGKAISNAWNTLKANLPMGAEESIIAQTPRSMRAVVEDMLSGKPEGFNPTVSEMIQLRKFFRDLGETEGLPDRTQATYSKMENASSDALDAAAKKNGWSDQWEKANAGWKDYKMKYGDPRSPFYRIINSRNPVQTVTSLQNAPATDIEALKNEMKGEDPGGTFDGLDPLRRQVVKDIQSSRYRIGADDGIGGYSHAYLNTLFSPEQLKELYVQGDLARRINYDPNPSGTGSNISSVSQLGLWNQTKMSAAARLSMPRDPLSYLQEQPKVRATPFTNPRTVAAPPGVVSPITGAGLAVPGQLFKKAANE